MAAACGLSVGGFESVAHTKKSGPSARDIPSFREVRERMGHPPDIG
jgi:hypothetical protein